MDQDEPDTSVMRYSIPQVRSLLEEQEQLFIGFQRVMTLCIIAGRNSPIERVKDHLVHGAGRRIKILNRTVENIFSLLPPGASEPIPQNDLDDLQINMHAFVMNLYGVFDNWAWTIVCDRDLCPEKLKVKEIGMFSKKTQAYLPSKIRSYIADPEKKKWSEEYLKGFRHSLAHRIPLYIPPAIVSESQAERLNEIEAEQEAAMRQHRTVDYLLLQKEKEKVGLPGMFFVQSFIDDDEASGPVMLHPQVLCDSKLVIEFGDLFFAHWKDSA